MRAAEARTAIIPVVLFVYARTTHLARVLGCLRENRVPLLWIFADGAKGASDAARVAAVHDMVRAIDWCEVRLVERERNLGLGRNILTGVAEVARAHDAFIVWEDDLLAVPGIYDWLCSALSHYAAEPRVRSISAWTHSRVTPEGVGDGPYFDRRADCWVWAAWARSWNGMLDEDAVAKRAAAAAGGIAPDAYGGDLSAMADQEARRNIWAVRWLYHHFQQGGLCLRPPWSMVEHLGIEATATNAAGATEWSNGTLRPAPPIPKTWPEPVEHPRCRALWRAAYPPKWRARWRRLLAKIGMR